MHRILYIESACKGLLMVNGQFCGPLEGEGQAFPMGNYLEAYIQFFPFKEGVAPVTAALKMRDGQLIHLEPEQKCFALIWPDGVVQLEIRAQEEVEQLHNTAQSVAADTLLRYLTMKIAGDDKAEHLLMQGASGIDSAGYTAAVPLRFAPEFVSDRYDERAGLVRRILPNAAVVDAVFAGTVPAGQGRRMIEKIEILRTQKLG